MKDRRLVAGLALLVLLFVIAVGCIPSDDEGVLLGGGSTDASVTTLAEQPEVTEATAPPETVPAEPIRIMPLGDSITEQSPYRAALLALLDDGGCSYDFVGSMLDVSFVDGRDPDHEGHGGWAADQIVDEAFGWASASQPQIVLLHIGTNDFYRGESVESTIDEVSRIVAELRKATPEVNVLLGQIIPGVGIEEPVEAYNLALASLALDLDTPASPVRAVDVSTGFDWQFDTVDEVHPTEAGGKKIADRWYATLSQLPQLGCTN